MMLKPARSLFMIVPLKTKIYLRHSQSLKTIGWPQILLLMEIDAG